MTMLRHGGHPTPVVGTGAPEAEPPPSGPPPVPSQTDAPSAAEQRNVDVGEAR